MYVHVYDMYRSHWIHICMHTHMYVYTYVCIYICMYTHVYDMYRSNWTHFSKMTKKTQTVDVYQTIHVYLTNEFDTWGPTVRLYICIISCVQIKLVKEKGIKIGYNSSSRPNVFHPTTAARQPTSFSGPTRFDDLKCVPDLYVYCNSTATYCNAPQHCNTRPDSLR